MGAQLRGGTRPVVGTGLEYSGGVLRVAANAYDGVTMTGGAGAAAAVARPVVLTEKQANGNSTSGVAGTAICSIAAGANKRLIGIVVFLQTTTVNSQVVVTVTYSDDSTETFTSTSAATFGVVLNGGLSQRLDASAAPAVAFAGMASKAVKSVAATTTGAGTGSRTVAMRAVEVGA